MAQKPRGPDLGSPIKGLLEWPLRNTSDLETVSGRMRHLRAAAEQSMRSCGMTLNLQPLK